MTRSRFVTIYTVIALGTWAYLLFFNGFVYSHGNWMTQVPAAFLAAVLWPVYWGIIHWMY